MAVGTDGKVKHDKRKGQVYGAVRKYEEDNGTVTHFLLCCLCAACVVFETKEMRLKF